MTKPFSPLLSAIVLAVNSLLGTAPAHAVGRLMDVNMIDRDSGATLPVYRHDGQWWVAGQPGARYAIAVRNATGARLLGVVSVDGVNAISGETASWDQTGYVLSRRQRWRVTGWRKSDSEVAAFHFTALPLSYAARTGRPDHVGVIRVAVFRELEAIPPPVAMTPAPDERETLARARAAPSAEYQRQNDSALAKPAAPRLGTGHGERESSHIGHTSFERRSEQPDEIITIRYDSRDNLIALGVIPAVATPYTRPAPFPESARNGYVPDP
jgi:hypothetical protein